VVVKNIINHTYQLVRDVRYRDGIEKIEGAYENFLRGAINLGNTLNRLKVYMYGGGVGVPKSEPTNSP